MAYGLSQQEYLDLIVDIAREIETEDPLDWGMLTIDEDAAYRMIASNVIEMMGDKYNQPMAKESIIATITKLVVENFILNLKLRSINVNS